VGYVMKARVEMTIARSMGRIGEEADVYATDAATTDGTTGIQ